MEFSIIPNANDELEGGIRRELDQIADRHQLSLSGDDLGTRFRDLIQGMAGDHKVAILIDEYAKRARILYLSFPNKEVESSFYFNLLSARSVRSANNTSLLVRIKEAFHAGEIKLVIEALDSLFANIAYPIQVSQEDITQIKEKQYFQGHMHINKEIVALGIGFDLEQRNIGDYEAEDVKVAT